MSMATPAPRTGAPDRPVGLRVGDRVRVRSRDEILATLDADGRVDGLPFMPEMLAFAGRDYVVDAVVHRTCDTVKTSGTSGTTRGMERAVHLAGVRCDGAAHGGCQARCLLYWKEDWIDVLQPAEPGEAAVNPPPARVTDVPDVLASASRGEGHTDAEPVYSCQATELLNATHFVSPRDPRTWIKDVRSGNARARTAVASGAVIAFNKWQAASTRLPRALRIQDGRNWPSYVPTGEKRRHPPLDLRPGELVEVKSQAEIEATLDDKGELRRLRFGAEMLPYCGTRARVLGWVDRIIDEKTGRMLRLRDCIILDGVWCQGTFRALCRRKIYTYWREAWLRRVDENASAPARAGDLVSTHSGATTVRVAAAVVTYNRRDVLRSSLAALHTQTRPLDDIIVVDNGSSDGTAEMVAAEFPAVRIVPMSENTGAAGGFAECLREGEARGHDWAWVFNDDDTPAPDALATMLDAAAHVSPRAGIIACGRTDGAGGFYPLGAHWNGRHQHVPLTDPAGAPFRLDVVTFSGTLVASQLVRDIGVPRTDFFMMVEDLEYCLRARRAGWNVHVVPRPLVTSHTLGSVGHAPPWRGYYQTRNQLTMTLEHRSIRELWWWCVRNAKFCAGAFRSGDQPVERLRLRALGAWHGARGVSGRTIAPTSTSVDVVSGT
jgi:GT2 family glycosyltransferase